MLDIGTNVANHTLCFAAHGHRVIAFEANPKMSAIAKTSIKINHFEEKITLYECGLSDKEEELYFEREIPENYGGMRLVEKSQMGGGKALNAIP